MSPKRRSPQKTTEKRKRGRPRVLDRDKIMRAVCERIANGELVRDAAHTEGCSDTLIRRWANEDDGFGTLYARAREAQAHALAEDAVRIADDAAGMTSEGVQAQRLRVDTRKWLASKIAPRHYGDKLDVTSDNKRLSGVIMMPPVVPDQP